MTANLRDDLSLHMCIPADRCYLGNAILTLEGICDHFSFTESSRDRIKKALDTVLTKSIEHTYGKIEGLFELHFSIYKDKLVIDIEDYFLESDEVIISNSDEIKNLLMPVEDLTDGLLFIDKKGRNSCFSMAFNLTFIEYNE